MLALGILFGLNCSSSLCFLHIRCSKSLTIFVTLCCTCSSIVLPCIGKFSTLNESHQCWTEGNILHNHLSIADSGSTMTSTFSIFKRNMPGPASMYMSRLFKRSLYDLSRYIFLASDFPTSLQGLGFLKVDLASRHRSEKRSVVVITGFLS